MRHILSNIQDSNSPIDIHCHQSSAKDHRHIVNLDSLTLANADDEAIAKVCLSNSQTECYASLGIHPWHIERIDVDLALRHLDKIAINSAIVALGECGLDKAIDTPLPLQNHVFSRQIELSERLGKPLIVHCVRAFGELLQLKKGFAPRQPWIIHGFIGKPTLARQLLQNDCYLSFGKALLHNRNAQLSLLATPIEQLFLETDAAIDVTIGGIYGAAAKILQLDLPTLQRQIVANFNRVFTHD